MCFDGRTLTLMDITPSTIWMSGVIAGPGHAPKLDDLPAGAFPDRRTDRARRQAGPVGCHMRGTASLLEPEARIAGGAVVRAGAPRLTALGPACDIEGTTAGDSGVRVLLLGWSDAPGLGDPSEPPPPRGSTT
jgi:hypothetical protein